MKTSSNLVRDIRRYYTGQLEALYGPEEANAMMMMLMEHYFGINRVKMALEPELRLSESEMLTVHFAVKDLLKNKPIQYVIGETEFCGMRFMVNENVLIPRPETEEMVNQLVSYSVSRSEINFSSSFRAKRSEVEKSPVQNIIPIRILDIGTGSGCIAISLAKSLKNSIVTAVDFSEGALQVAKKNAEANGVDVRFILDDILHPQNAELLENKFDIIVSNPPYVCESEKSEMRANVLDHEPASALFVPDSDPLIFYRKILEFAQTNLNPKGEVWFEINEKFGAETTALCHEKGFNKVEVIKDFRDKERIVRVKS